MTISSAGPTPTLLIAASLMMQPPADLGAQEPPPWETVADAPAWCADPPQRAGFLRFCTTGRSNGAPIAQTQAAQPSRHQLVRLLADRLAVPADSRELVAVADAVDRAKVPLRRAFHSRVLTQGAVPGNTLTDAWVLWEVPLTVLLAGATAPEPRAPAADEAATALRAAANWVGPLSIEVMESHPLQFAVNTTVPMPTPGWTLRVDRVTAADPDGRIRAWVTEIAPDGMVAQVITDTPLRIAIGVLPPGSLVLEISTRRGEAGSYRRRDIVHLEATR